MASSILLMVSLAGSVSSLCNPGTTVSSQLANYCINRFHSPVLENSIERTNLSSVSHQDIANQSESPETFLCNEIEKRVSKVRSKFQDSVNNLKMELKRKREESCAGFWYKNYCFWGAFRPYRSINRVEAKQICHEYGESELANIYSETHYNATVKYLKQEGNKMNVKSFRAWTGMTRDNPSGVAMLSNGDPPPFLKLLTLPYWGTMAAKETFIYLLTWNHIIPIGSEDGLGSILPEERLNAALCQSRHPVNLKKNASATASPIPIDVEETADEACPGFTYNSSCYWSVISISGDIDLPRGNRYCNRDGRSRLADIFSKEHYNMAEEYLRSRKHETAETYIAAWTGMTRHWISGELNLSDGQRAPYVGKTRNSREWHVHGVTRTKVYLFLWIDGAPHRRDPEGFGNIWPKQQLNAVLCQYP